MATWSPITWATWQPKTLLSSEKITAAVNCLSSCHSSSPVETKNKVQQLVLRKIEMALLVPGGGAGFARITLSPGSLCLSRRFTLTSAALSSPPKETANWVEATSSFFEGDSRPIMLFDGVCNLCNGGVRFVRANDRNRRMRFEALQSEAGRNLLRRSGREPDDISSVVLVEKDRAYIKSDAVLKIMEYIDLPFPQLAFFLQFVPAFLRDFMYDNVANNRYAFFGRSDSCEI